MIDLPPGDTAYIAPREYFCPACGHKLAAAMPSDEVASGPPEEGHVSICWYCGHLMIFGEGGVLRNPTAQEQAELDADASIQEALAVVANHLRRQ